MWALTPPPFPFFTLPGLDFWDRVNQQKWEPETLWVLQYYLSKVGVQRDTARTC